MKQSMIALLLAAGLASALAVPALAYDDAPKAAGTPATKAAPIEVGSLSVGDKAPALSIAKWVRGSEVSSFQKGNTYVVEFWATWCPPCRKSIPHLTQLQKDFQDKGVTIIGVTSEDPRNSLADVQKMVAAKGDEMAYTVAWDNGRQTNEAYMMAAAQNGIPTAFIVDKNQNIAWIGSPFEMDEPLTKIVAGTFDVAAARKEFQAGQQATINQMAFGRAAKQKDLAAMLTSGEKLLKSSSEDPQTMNMIAWLIVDPQRGFDLKSNPKLVVLAEQAAVKANDATGGTEPGVLDTLARVQFVKGDKAAAIATQQKAIGLANDPDMKKDLEASLKEFQAAK